MSNAKAEIAAARAGAKLSGIAIVAVLLLIIVLVGIAIYVSFPTVNNHFLGLVAIGLLGVVVSVLGVFAQAASRDPAMARAASAGAFWFGVAVLLGAGLVAPDGAFTGSPCPAGGAGTACLVTYSLSTRIVYLVIVLLIVVAGLLYMRWQLSGRARDVARQAKRQGWEQRHGVSPAAGTGVPSANDPRSDPPT